MGKHFRSSLFVFRCLFLFFILVVLLGGCSKKNVGSVWQGTIKVAEEVGTAIKENAAALYGVVRSRWRTWFPKMDGKVKVDPQNPLRGTFEGNYVLIIDIKGKGMKLKYSLEDPIVEREGAGWFLSKKNFPEGASVPRYRVQ